MSEAASLFGRNAFSMRLFLCNDCYLIRIRDWRMHLVFDIFEIFSKILNIV